MLPARSSSPISSEKRNRSSEVSGCFCQMPYDRKMLGTDLLALSASDTVSRLARVPHKLPVAERRSTPALCRRFPLILVIKREYLGDWNPHRTAGSAVGAACAGDGGLLRDDRCCLKEHLLLLLPQRKEFRHIGSVILQLFHGAHSRQNHGSLQAAPVQGCRLLPVPSR